METRTKTFTVTDYVAFDGVVFADEKACIAYEEKCKLECNNRILSKIHTTDHVGDKDIWSRFSGYEDTVYAIRIDNENDLKAANIWGNIEFNTSWDDIESSAIGTIQIIDTYDYDTYNFGTPEQLKAEFCKAIDDLCGDLINKTQEEKS